MHDAGYGARQPAPTDTVQSDEGVYEPIGEMPPVGVVARQKAQPPARAPEAQIERKANGEVPVINDGMGNIPTIRVYGSNYGMPAAMWTPREYQHAASAGYRKNSDVYACVDLIASAGKQCKFWDGSGNSKAVSPPEILIKAIGIDPDIYRQSAFDGEAKLRAAADPRASIELLKRSGGARFIEEWLSYMLLSGNAWIEIARPSTNGLPSMLYLDNPGLVTVDINREALHPDQLVNKWIVSNGYGARRYLNPWREGRGDIVQSKLFSPDAGPYGMAPLEAAMIRVDAQNEGATLMKRVLQRGYVPGWIEAKENSDWGDEQVAQLKENVRRSKMHGEELFLENAVWHDMGFKPGEAGLSEQQILTKRDIASVFHVDPALIGDTTGRTYATYRESRRGLYMEAVIPLLTQFRDDWNRTIGAELKSPLDFDKDSFDAIAAARDEAADRVHKLWSSGLITQNEGRRDLEYPAVEGGDAFYAPANFMPLAGTGEAAEVTEEE